MDTPRSAPEVVVLVRIAGNVFAVRRVGTGLSFLRLKSEPTLARMPDQTGALALLRRY